MTKLLRKIGEWLRSHMCNHYSNCYSAREYEGIAVFGLCGGLMLDEEIRPTCKECPYFVGANNDLEVRYGRYK